MNDKYPTSFSWFALACLMVVLAILALFQGDIYLAVLMAMSSLICMSTSDILKALDK